jgi:pantoate--beta-alanine ligase
MTRIARSQSELDQMLAPWRDSDIALVPTMGALHAGHLSLVRLAKARTPHVVVSIFVNPAQFAPGEDFAAYPRPFDTDLEKLESAEAAVLFAPSAQDIYPQGFATSIQMAGPALGLESAARPHFFAGVATVVAKLLLAVRPAIAVFGEKDYQQLLVVRRLVKDLGLPVDILAAPIARESDGLAMSSRNVYLGESERVIAGRLNQVLAAATDRLRAGDPVAAVERDAGARLEKSGFDSVDYVAVRDAESLDPVATLDRPCRILAAVRIGRTRLIDNMAV